MIKTWIPLVVVSGLSLYFVYELYKLEMKRERKKKARASCLVPNRRHWRLMDNEMFWCFFF